MPRPIQSFQIDVGDTPHLDIVQGQRSFNVCYACSSLKVGMGKISSVFINSYTQVSVSSGARKFEKDIPHVLNTPLKIFQKRSGSAQCQRMLAFCEALH